MNLNYGIFRSQSIMTINDLAQIESHSKIEKKAYNSNPDIKLDLTKNNIELVPLAEKYVKGFKFLVKDYEKEHNERMKTERPERKKSFNEMLNRSKSVVADELMFIATYKFFDNMSKEEIIRRADTCMDFVYNDLGYKKEQILHATIHMDELTPHIYCVVVPLVKKLDKRTNTERYTISKKQYIKNNILSVVTHKNYEPLCLSYKVKGESDIDIILPFIKSSYELNKINTYDLKNKFYLYYTNAWKRRLLVLKKH